MLHGKGNKATTRGFHPSATDALARWTDIRRQAGSAAAPCSAPCAAARCTPVRPQPPAPAWPPEPGSASGSTRTACGHTFAWGLENPGPPVTVISALPGHSSVAVTARYLNHLTSHQAVTALAAADLPEAGL